MVVLIKSIIHEDTIMLRDSIIDADRFSKIEAEKKDMATIRSAYKK